jgi:dihydrofolate reductase
MRKILLNLAVTIDGYIAGPNGEYDWCFTDDDYGLTAFGNRVDTLVMGRKTYEVIVPYVEKWYADKNLVVFSRTLNQTPFGNVDLVQEDPLSYVRALKLQPGKDIWLYGGAELVAAFRNASAIDEMHLSVHPLLLGDGIPLFGKGERTLFELVESIPYRSGLVQLIYRRKNPGPWDD